MTSLDPAVISQIALTALGNKTAWLGDFSTDFGSFIDKKATVNVPLYTGGTTLVDASNFATGDGTGAKIPVAVEHLYQPIALSYADFNNGHKLETQVGAAVNALLDTMQAKAFAVLTTSNFGSAVTGVAPASLSTTNLKTAWGSVAGKEKVCYMTSTAYQNFLPTSVTDFDPAGQSAYGFKRLTYADSFTGAASGVYGFVSADKAGIAIACGLPIVPEGMGVTSEVIDLGNGLQALFSRFVDANTRSAYAGVEVMFGCKAGDTNAIKLIRSN